MMHTRKQMPVIPGQLWCKRGQHYMPQDQFRCYPSKNNNPYHDCIACEQQRSKDDWQKFKQTEIPYRLLSPVNFF